MRVDLSNKIRVKRGTKRIFCICQLENGLTMNLSNPTNPHDHKSLIPVPKIPKYGIHSQIYTRTGGTEIRNSNTQGQLSPEKIKKKR